MGINRTVSDTGKKIGVLSRKTLNVLKYVGIYYPRLVGILQVQASFILPRSGISTGGHMVPERAILPCLLFASLYHRLPNSPAPLLFLAIFLLHLN